jgi:3-methyladenine DNA glycosylase AlkD
MTMIEKIQAELAAAGNISDAAFLQRYFKTGPGQYGEGDVFRGIRVPVLRKIAAANRNLPIDQAAALLASVYHEDRLLALLVLVNRFDRGEEEEREAIYGLYRENSNRINNWDLVDCSAPHIVGGWFLLRDRSPLLELARSSNIWERRTAVMATFRFIREGDFAMSLELAGMLLEDRHDLIHKAAGWMLREVGKRDLRAEEGFLAECYRRMPRTMLRYAIERFPREKRLAYLNGLI